jgi:hypothetical protein
MVCERPPASPTERGDDPMDGRSRADSDDSDLEEGARGYHPFVWETNEENVLWWLLTFIGHCNSFLE